MLQGAAVLAQLLPLLRFLQAAAHHASKPPEPEVLTTAEDFGSSPAPTESAGLAADASVDHGSAATEPASSPGARQAAAASAGGAVEAAAEAGAAAGAGPGADGADVAPVAVPGAAPGAQEGSGESEIEDMDEDEDQYLDEEMDDEGDTKAQVHVSSAGTRRCLLICLSAVSRRVKLFWGHPRPPSASCMIMYKKCC